MKIEYIHPVKQHKNEIFDLKQWEKGPIYYNGPS